MSHVIRARAFTPPSAKKNRRSMFPKRGLLIGLVTLMVLYITGFPPRAAVFFSVMAFLLSGGWLYIKLVYITFPRDLWYELCTTEATELVTTVYVIAGWV